MELNVGGKNSMHHYHRTTVTAKVGSRPTTTTKRTIESLRRTTTVKKKHRQRVFATAIVALKTLNETVLHGNTVVVESLVALCYAQRRTKNSLHGIGLRESSNSN